MPEEVLENYEYNITYEVLDGQGHFEDMEGNPLEAGKGWNVPTNLAAPLMYMGSETGSHRVKVVGTDNFGLSAEIEVMYDLSDVPVIWEASSELSELELAKPVDLSLLFETDDAAEDIGYEAIYGLDTGSGSLEASEENGYAPNGEYGPIDPGTYPLVFTPSEVGPQQLVFTLRDSNGQEIEAGLDFNVVEFIDVISISHIVKCDTIKMKLGDEIPPAFTFDPPNATDQGVTVVSSDPDVVFIDENNVCIAVGLGTAEVTVTSVSNPEASDTVTVVVIEADRIPVTGITVSQEDPGATGTERQLLAAVLPEDATDPSVTWSSSDDTIASIDENGLLTGLFGGYGHDNGHLGLGPGYQGSRTDRDYGRFAVVREQYRDFRPEGPDRDRNDRSGHTYRFDYRSGGHAPERGTYHVDGIGRGNYCTRTFTGT
ncbi:Ig-like domain-containing protein [Zobellia laminariae]|uniref:Ig-like domain-containing protein n=1 Tax=Zobellia laminariae TaxID=248906 RepID=UPI0026F44DC1|nr:Ig-like domain-containing protein [Zobellia laminariae]WKX74842.1 Ig-like domain-containing protein [Zobellia laminariae]